MARPKPDFFRATLHPTGFKPIFDKGLCRLKPNTQV